MAAPTTESREARLKRLKKANNEGEKAMQEYMAELQASRDKTAVLRAKRLAHEAAQAKDGPPVKAPAKKAARR